jgi:hypothetical protein
MRFREFFKITKRKIIITFLIWLILFNFLPFYFSPLVSNTFLALFFPIFLIKFLITDYFFFGDSYILSLLITLVSLLFTLEVSLIVARFVDLFLKTKQAQFLNQAVWKSKRKWLTIGIILMLIFLFQCFFPGVIIEVDFKKYSTGEKIEITASPIRIIFEPITKKMWQLYKFENGKWEKIEANIEPPYPEKEGDIKYLCGESEKCGGKITRAIPFCGTPLLWEGYRKLYFLPSRLSQPEDFYWDQIVGYKIEECTLNEKEKVKCYKKEFALPGKYKIEFSYSTIYFPKKINLKRPYFERKNLFYFEKSQTKEFLIK